VRLGGLVTTVQDVASVANGNHDLPFAKELFEAADRLRGSVESAEYKHLVLGLLFLKYISDAFERRRAWLDGATRDPENRDYHCVEESDREAILEDRDEYISENVFWVPEEARWSALLAAASLPDIGERIDKALDAIERDNVEQLRGVLPKIYARAPIQPAKLGSLVDTIAKIGFGDDPDRARDILGRTYEYFIGEFARSEGHRGGEFYTPASVVPLLVEMLEPFEGRVLDPACGSGGLFIQSAEFVKAHGGRARQLSILGQENNQATWRICRMNLAIHGLGGDIKLGDSLLDDKFPGARADYVLANPPFNLKKWGPTSVAKDARWTYGEPPDGNANYAWIQHFIHHLTPDGRAGFVMANGSLTSTAVLMEISRGKGSVETTREMFRWAVPDVAQTKWLSQLTGSRWPEGRQLRNSRDDSGRRLDRSRPTLRNRDGPGPLATSTDVFYRGSTRLRDGPPAIPAPRNNRPSYPHTRR
jgi:type I restriction enzyme M protein